MIKALLRLVHWGNLIRLGVAGLGQLQQGSPTSHAIPHAGICGHDRHSHDGQAGGDRLSYGFNRSSSFDLARLRRSHA